MRYNYEHMFIFCFIGTADLSFEFEQLTVTSCNFTYDEHYSIGGRRIFLK